MVGVVLKSLNTTMNFTCLDFETANFSRVSICAAGIAVFENGRLAESLHWLIRPPMDYGWFLPEFTENCHGLTWLDVQHAPFFSSIAPELLSRLIGSEIVVTHNAPFDIGALRATLDHFDLPCPEFDFLCTYRLAARVWPELPNHRLDTLAAHIGHEFHHHHAQADAEAAGQVLLAMMNHVGANTPRELLKNAGMVSGRFVQ